MTQEEFNRREKAAMIFIDIVVFGIVGFVVWILFF